jgi:peroxiredoxin Q/BCP
MGMMPGRITFVIDQGGVIRHVFSSMMNFGAHVDEALAVVKQLRTA